MTLLRDFSTSSGSARTCLRSSSFLRRASTSLPTVKRVVPLLSSTSFWLSLLLLLEAEAIFSWAATRVSASRFCSFLSSSATRA